MLQERISDLLKNSVTSFGLLRWWEQHITPWPRVILYHYVGSDSPRFLHELALERKGFLEQIARLQSRYRFLSWTEYKEALTSPSEAYRCVLLSFDDGFRNSWTIAEELAAERQIPAVFFVNTRVLDNAYCPWMIQYYFLRAEANGRFLEPLWKSISGGTRLSRVAARQRSHECFGVQNVVAPIEEGLAKFGITPGELAQRYQLYMSSADVAHRNILVTIGNHSHSHYVLSKLPENELRADLRLSHNILSDLLSEAPDCFAYPFGVPRLHLDARCPDVLRTISSYPYIFSGTDALVSGASNLSDIPRVCLDRVDPPQVVAKVAKVTPRTLKDYLWK